MKMTHARRADRAPTAPKTKEREVPTRPPIAKKRLRPPREFQRLAPASAVRGRSRVLLSSKEMTRGDVIGKVRLAKSLALR
jgi:hypothetical protein